MPKPEGTNLRMVSYLIDTTLGSWHEDVVRGNFLLCDVEEIFSIPLNQSWPRDKHVWHYTMNASFMVKSSYHLQSNEVVRRDVGTSNPQNHIWKTIWKLNLPPCIKVFIWRICYVILPTNENINSRVPTFNPNCSLCCHYIDSEVHALLYCPLAT